MTIEKAIEIGELNIKEAGKKMPPDTLDALKLLVEAGKRLQVLRKDFALLPTVSLPSETPE